MRVKEKMQQDKDLAFEDDLSFAEYLQHYMSEPTEAELDAMEHELKIKSTIPSHQPLNNTYYNTLQGA